MLLPGESRLMFFCVTGKLDACQFLYPHTSVEPCTGTCK